MKIDKVSRLLAAGLIVLFGGFSVDAYTVEDCLGCHVRGGTSSLIISLIEYRNSVHGKDLSCLDCHTGIRDESHRTRPGSGTVRCEACHAQENRHGLQAKDRLRPRCHDCHTRHAIRSPADPQSSVHPDRLPVTCGTCHPQQSGKSDFLSWTAALRIKSHPKQDFGRPYRDKDCLGCHQGQAAHGEERPTNDQACFKCHQPAQGKNPLWGSIHPRADWKERPDLAIAAVADQAGVGILAAGVLLLLFRGVLRSVRGRK